METRRSARIGLAIALALFAAWTAATWFLEGRIHTLLRPEAVIDRLVYALVGSLLLGVVGGAACMAYLVRRGVVEARAAGFGGAQRTVFASAAGLVLGLGAYVLQGAPSLHPVVILNAFSQVFVVSAAEVVVCWCAVGAAAEAAVGRDKGLVAMGVAALGAAALFGLHHFAHSPPFDTWAMVSLLTVVGLFTGAFFFASRDAVGTAVFHNFLGTFGVLQALAKADALRPLEQLQPRLLGTALVTLVVLLAAQALIGRQRAPGVAPGDGPRPRTAVG